MLRKALAREDRPAAATTTTLRWCSACVNSNLLVADLVVAHVSVSLSPQALSEDASLSLSLSVSLYLSLLFFKLRLSSGGRVQQN